MKINYIKMKGFRKFEDVFETDLYDITTIVGKNRAGKSNILYAIIFTLLGTNLTGNEKENLINKNCDNAYCELHFEDNRGEKHILVRKKNKYSNKENIVLLDGKPTKQEELTSFYNEKKLFLSIINPLYFLSKKPAEQKEMVDKYLSNIKPIEIFNSLSEEMKEKLIIKYSKNTKDFKNLTQKEQEDFINYKMLNICMDIAYNNLSLDEQLKLEVVPTNIPEFISELNSNIKDAENKISNLDGKIGYAEGFASQEIESKREFEKDEELTLLLQEYDFLKSNSNDVQMDLQKNIVQNIENEIAQYEDKKKLIETEMLTGKKQYLSIKTSADSYCPMCNQKLEATGKEITIKKMHEELTELFNKKTELENKLNELKTSLLVEKSKFYALDAKDNNSEQEKLETLKNDIDKLENEKKQIDLFNSQIEMKEKNKNGAISDISIFIKEKDLLQDNIEKIKEAKQIAQKLYISYIEEKMKLAKKYLTDVDIKFYTVLKTTGEIKEDFIITYKNTPLQNLSRSETIATALEFANLFNKISNSKIPIFIDDYESCADYNFVDKYSNDSQLFLAKVEKGKELQINDYLNNNAELIAA